MKGNEKQSVSAKIVQKRKIRKKRKISKNAALHNSSTDNFSKSLKSTSDQLNFDNEISANDFNSKKSKPQRRTIIIKKKKTKSKTKNIQKEKKEISAVQKKIATRSKQKIILTEYPLPEGKKSIDKKKKKNIASKSRPLRKSFKTSKKKKTSTLKCNTPNNIGDSVPLNGNNIIYTDSHGLCDDRDCEDFVYNDYDSIDSYDRSDFDSLMDYYNFDYDSDSNDSDYEPNDESLIIHQGLAVVRNLEPSDNIHFDSDIDEAQIIELNEEKFVKSTKQPTISNTEDLKTEYNSNLNKSALADNFEFPVNSNSFDDEYLESMSNTYDTFSSKSSCPKSSDTNATYNIESSQDSFEEIRRKKRTNQSDSDILKDDSDILKDNSENNEYENAEKKRKMSTSSSHTKFYNALDGNQVLVLLKDPFFIYGTMCVTVLVGEINIYGYTPSLHKEFEVFSPRGFCPTKIAAQQRCITRNYNRTHLEEILKDYKANFPLFDLKNLINLYDHQNDAVILLKRNIKRKYLQDQFKKFMDEGVFPSIHTLATERALYTTESLLHCIINTTSTDMKCLHMPSEWLNMTMSDDSKVIVVGGKSVGKSTLVRYLINRHLSKFSRLLVIDLDIGQSELFVPQTVSCKVVTEPFIGPGFLFNLQPDKAFAVGHINIILCAPAYVDAVKNLSVFCKTQDEYKNMPWLINTMGYNKGFGMELLSVILREFEVTDLIQLQSNKEINNFDSVLYPHVMRNIPQHMFDGLYSKIPQYEVHVWQSAVLSNDVRQQTERDMSAKDKRYATLLARLSSVLYGSADFLADCKPLCASLNDLKFVNLLETVQCSEEDIIKATEANLVYLCYYAKDQTSLECYGIGVVRAIDFNSNCLYLLPAMSYTQLENVNCLAIGSMPLPTNIYTNQGPRVMNEVPFVYSTEDTKSTKAVKHFCRRPNDININKSNMANEDF